MSARIVFPGRQSNAIWCQQCTDWIMRGESCEHFTVSMQSPAEFARDRGVAPPRGELCLRHFSWLCQKGQGKCQSEGAP